MTTDRARRERIARAYLAMRRERDLLMGALASASDYARRLQSQLDIMTDQQANARRAATAYMKEGEAADKRERIALAKRRRAVLTAREFQRRLYAEYNFVDQLRARQRVKVAA
ncbi:MAG: hypothetical protein JNM03_09585 [Sphingopyxis sp.]|uniref:hypothetical protein n=1 Tax=Sphingopyxis sp. TaxID=1908224 RepID=UPI001A4264C6|nr:hypothetical protein [Sphingopyxis sp.]MBL9070229.1 hypothetical protein [Sphingopyxis sp.]